jgi:hypothetical protein
LNKFLTGEASPQNGHSQVSFAQLEKNQSHQIAKEGDCFSVSCGQRRESADTRGTRDSNGK